MGGFRKGCSFCKGARRVDWWAVLVLKVHGTLVTAAVHCKDVGFGCDLVVEERHQSTTSKTGFGVYLRVYLWVVERDGRDEGVVGGNRLQKVNTLCDATQTSCKRVGQNATAARSAAGKTSVKEAPSRSNSLVASVHEPAPPCRLCHVDFDTKVGHLQFSTTEPQPAPSPPFHHHLASADRPFHRTLYDPRNHPVRAKGTKTHHVRRGLSCGATGQR